MIMFYFSSTTGSGPILGQGDDSSMQLPIGRNMFASHEQRKNPGCLGYVLISLLVFKRVILTSSVMLLM